MKIEEIMRAVPMIFSQVGKTPLEDNQFSTLLAMEHETNGTVMYLKIPAPAVAPSHIVLEFRDTETGALIDCFVADVENFLRHVIEFRTLILDLEQQNSTTH